MDSSFGAKKSSVGENVNVAKDIQTLKNDVESTLDGCSQIETFLDPEDTSIFTIIDHDPTVASIESSCQLVEDMQDSFNFNSNENDSLKESIECTIEIFHESHILTISSNSSISPTSIHLINMDEQVPPQENNKDIAQE